MARYSRKPVDVLSLLQQNALFQGQQQTELVCQLNTELQQFLQLEKLTFCQVKRINHDRVQILCQSSSWSSRLLRQRDALLSHFRQRVWAGFTGLDIEVNPKMNLQYVQAPLVAKREAPQLSEQAAHYLRQVAATSSPELAARLERLATLAKSK